MSAIILDGLTFLSLRSVTGFFGGFGWTGVLALQTGLSLSVAVRLGVGASWPPRRRARAATASSRRCVSSGASSGRKPSRVSSWSSSQGGWRSSAELRAS